MAPALQAACASQIFLGSGSPVVLFPITPALSLGEREKQGSVLGRGWACKANTPCGPDAQRRMWLPLPKGEGGVRGKQPFESKTASEKSEMRTQAPTPGLRR